MLSYSAMMANYLSFFGSRSKASKGTPPDENYGRELMQLFTLGLWRLNDDGTPVRRGENTYDKIDTYDQDDMHAHM